HNNTNYQYIQTSSTIPTHILLLLPAFILFFFIHDTPTTQIYTLSLHDALPISKGPNHQFCSHRIRLHPFKISNFRLQTSKSAFQDRKSTRLTPVTFRSRMPSSA